MAPPIHPPSPAALSSEEGETLGAVLADLRLSMGLSQRQLIGKAFQAQGAGLVVSAATHWERDRRVPSPAHLLTLLRVLLPPSEPERTAAFERVLGAAARSSSVYGPSLKLVGSKLWTFEQWEDWACSVRRS